MDARMQGRMHVNLHTYTLIKLVWRSTGGPQDNIFIAIIKEKLAYGPSQANIWLWVSSIIHPLRNMQEPNFSAMKQRLKKNSRKRKTVWAFTRPGGFRLINQTCSKCISGVPLWLCHWGVCAVSGLGICDLSPSGDGTAKSLIFPHKVPPGGWWSLCADKLTDRKIRQSLFVCLCVWVCVWADM